MKCMLVKHHGGKEEYKDIIYKSDQWPRPNRNKGQLLLRVLACSLAPGDVRVMSGKTKYIQMPKSGFPYIPGGDVVGIVEESDPECDKFKVGDCVISRFYDAPSGGLAEYCVARTSTTALKPENIGIIEAAALPASVVVAIALVKTWVNPGDRVLVLGATGGVGSHVVQLLKTVGEARFVAAATQTVHYLEDKKETKNVDKIIDYTKEDWWKIPEFQEEKFDLLLDFAAFENAWENCTAILKDGRDGGRFITTSGDSHTFNVLGVCDIISLMKKMFARNLWTRINKSLPRWCWFVGGLADPIKDETWSTLFKAINEGHLKVVIDEKGPFPFTEQGVRDAFHLQESRHVHGKVVIQVADDGLIVPQTF